MKKYIRNLVLTSLLTISAFRTTAGADVVGAYIGHGDSQNFLYMGIVMTNTTLSDAISIQTPLGVEWSDQDKIGIRIWKWSQASQSWGNYSEFDEWEMDWYPNLSIDAGDVLRINYNPNNGTNCVHSPDDVHTSDVYVYQKGQRFIGTKQFTIKPGWNLIALPAGDAGLIPEDSNEYDLNFPFEVGDVAYLTYDAAALDFSPCSPPEHNWPFGWEWHYTNTPNSWYNPDIPATYTGIAPGLEDGSAVWVEAVGSVNRTWTCTFPQP